MSLVDGEERATIPSMSWSSVVGDHTVDVHPEPSADEHPPLTESTTASVSFEMAPLVDDAAPEPPSPEPPPAPPPAPIAFTMGGQVAADQPGAAASPFSAGSEEDTDATVPTKRPDTTPPGPLSVPIERDASTAPSLGDSTVELPAIVEATPPESVVRSVAALHVDPTPADVPVAPIPVERRASAGRPAHAAGPTPLADPTPVEQPAPVEQATAAVASAAQTTQATMSLPRVAVAPAVPHVSPTVVLGGPPKPSAKKDRSPALARLGFFLLFIAAVVSAGVIFGRPYLFPAEWEDNALPYAEAIEQARGADFVEPVRLTAQDNASHRDLVSQQLLGEAQQNMPLWRALGLAGPDATDDASLRDLTAGQSPVLYSTADGQVYYDQTFSQAHRDRLITQAMAAAALDQEVKFSPNADQRGLDANALTDAHVLQQTSNIAEVAATTAVPIPESDVAALAFLPPVLDYRITAPVVLSKILAPVNDLAPNPLEGIGSDGPIAARDHALSVTSTSSAVAGDAPIGEAVSMDRGFWYLVLASHLDAMTAYEMSNTIEGAGLYTVQAADGRTCAVANFAVANRTSNERLGVSLASWTASAAPELGATVETLPDTTVQLRSCDPVGAFTSNARFGIGRELIGWRATETVVVDTLEASGADAATVSRALAQIGATPSVQELIGLPAGTPPSQVAAAVRTAAADVVAVTSAPAVDAGG